MHLGGNHRWVPLSFENNNNNNKRYRAHKFYFTISSAVSSIQLHGGGPNFAFFLGGKFLSSFTSLDNIFWSKTLLSKQISLVESRTYASGSTNNVTAG